MKGIFTIQKYKAEQIDGKWIQREKIHESSHENTVSYVQLLEWMDGLAASPRTSELFSILTSNAIISISSVFYKGKAQCGLSSRNHEENTTVDTVYPIHGDDIDGVSRVTFTGHADQSAGKSTLSQRWDPPATQQRSVNTVMVLNRNQSQTKYPLFSSVVLPTTLFQETNEIFVVIYTLQYDSDFSMQYPSDTWPGDDFYDINVMSRGMAMGYQFYYFPEYWEFRDLMPDDRNALPKFAAHASPTLISGEDRIDGFTTFSKSMALIDNIGEFMNHAAVINASSAGTSVKHQRTLQTVKTRRLSDTVVQNTFARSTEVGKSTFSASRPFLDVANIATGTGLVVISDTITTDTSWTELGWPICYKTEIIASGDIGTSTYKLSKRMYPGGLSDGATHASRATPMMHLPSVFKYGGKYKTDEHRGMLSNYGNNPRTPSNYICIEEYILPEFISANFDGINIWNLDPNIDPVTLSAASTPALPCTDIRQIRAFDNGNIIVACGNTGLWKIVRTPGSAQDIGTTITQIVPAGTQSPNSCWGFCTSVRITDKDYNNGAKWYALFGQEFGYSTDAGGTWTILNNSTSPQYKLTNFADTDGTVANGTKESNICGLFIDYWAKADTDAIERFAIITPDVLPSIGSSGQLHWWSTDGSAITSDEVRNTTPFGDGINAPLHGSRGVGIVKTPDGGGTSYKWIITSNSPSTSGISIWGTTTNASYINYSTGQVIFVYNSARDIEYYIGGDFVGTGKYNGVLFSGDDFDTNLPAREPAAITFAGESISNVNILNALWNFPAAYLGKGIVLYHQGTLSTSYYWRAVSLCDAGSGPSPDLRGDGFKIWDEYGWDGASWVKGHAGTKLTHAADENIIDGLKIKFEDASPSASSFIANEFYDTYVADGILKDDATSVEYACKLHYAPSVKGNVFTPAVLTGTARGVVGPEPVLFQTRSSEEIFIEPGWIGICNYIGAAKGEYSHQILTGDFSVKFNYYSQMGEKTTRTVGTFFGLVENSNKDTWKTAALGGATDGYPIRGMHIQYKTPVAGDTGKNVTMQFVESTVITDVPITDYEVTDDWEIRRTSGVLEVYRNTILVHTFGVNLTTDFVVAYRRYSQAFAEIDNCTVAYTDTALFTEIDAVQNDVNFREHVFYEYVDGSMELLLDGTPATIITGSASPAAGELAVGRSGRIDYNVADAGKTITGDYRYAVKYKLAAATGYTAPPKDPDFEDISIMVLFDEYHLASIEDWGPLGTEMSYNGTAETNLTITSTSVYGFALEKITMGSTGSYYVRTDDNGLNTAINRVAYMSDLTNPWTMEVSGRLPRLLDNTKPSYIVSGGRPAGADTWSLKFDDGGAADNQLHFTFNYADGTPALESTLDGVNEEQWYYLYVRNDGLGNMTAYVDGVTLGTVAIDTGKLLDIPESIYWASTFSSPTLSQNGTIVDQFRWTKVDRGVPGTVSPEFIRA